MPSLNIKTTLSPSPAPGERTDSRAFQDWFRQVYFNLGHHVGLPTYQVANLPNNATDGWMAFASNGRKAAEGVGAGTGVTVVYSNGQWRRLSDETQVLA